MKTKQSKTVVFGDALKAGLIGAAVAVLVVVVLSAIAAICLDRGIVAQEHMGAAGVIVRMLGMFSGAILAGAIVKEKKIQAALVTLLCVLFVLVGGTILFWDGMFANLLAGIVGCVLSGAAGVAVGMIPKKGRKASRSRYRYR